MKMVMYFVWVVTVAVLLCGATANFLSCIMQQMVIITPDNIILSPDQACQSIEAKFHQARLEMQKCSSFEVDISGIESVFQEYCSQNSSFRQRVERQRECLSDNMDNFSGCISTLMEFVNRFPESCVEEFRNHMCQSESDKVVNCLTESIGGPCGEEGLEIYGRLAVASKPLFMGSCMSAAEGVVSLDDYETNDCESSEASSDPSMARLHGRHNTLFAIQKSNEQRVYES